MIPLGALTSVANAAISAAPSAVATGLPAMAGAASGLGSLAQGATAALPAGAATLSMNGATTGLQNVGNFFKGVDRTLGQWGDALDPQTQMLKAMGVENPMGKLPGFLRFMKAGQPQFSKGNGATYGFNQGGNSMSPLAVGAMFKKLGEDKGTSGGGGGTKAIPVTESTASEPQFGVKDFLAGLVSPVKTDFQKSSDWLFGR